MPRYVPLEVIAYPAYIKVYAKRHNLPPKIVQENQMLATAALLENRMRNLRCSVCEARYTFLNQFPSIKVGGIRQSLNCLPTSASIIKIAGYSFRASVIELIKPMAGVRWDVPTCESLHKRRNQNEQSTL